MLLSYKEITLICNQHYHTKATFAGCLSWDNFPINIHKIPCFFIVDTLHSSSPETIGHFTVIIIQGEQEETVFFDSFVITFGGLKIDEPRPEIIQREIPVDLLEILIRTSCPPGGTVFDMFAGSGAAGEAARNAGRAYVGFETDPAMADKARNRLSSKLPLVSV